MDEEQTLEDLVREHLEEALEKLEDKVKASYYEGSEQDSFYNFILAIGLLTFSSKVTDLANHVEKAFLYVGEEQLYAAAMNHFLFLYDEVLFVNQEKQWEAISKDGDIIDIYDEEDSINTK